MAAPWPGAAQRREARRLDIAAHLHKLTKHVLMLAKHVLIKLRPCKACARGEGRMKGRVDRVGAAVGSPEGSAAWAALVAGERA
ncbi:hypothetical protein GCM10010994_26160 [Chelatococcus reniformis]|uniref:Uncharacterized protein n=1 Tax=Chelatococcus reniformis TaxID=1494448 RepID=A0A916UC28_9HYPH|nr:hypothetical protein GCM10010994_26160 [Chelatococcus reniformis]